MNLDIDKDWFAKKAAEEGDLEIGAGMRKTMTVNLRPDEIAILERLVNPEAAAQRARNADLSKAIEHWRHDVGKLQSQIGRRDDTLRECLGWIRHWQADVAGNLKPTPDSLAMMEAKLVAILQPVEAPEAAE